MAEPNRLKNRLVPLELYKFTRRNNCGECGQQTCLAFATQVIVGKEDIDACPFFDKSQINALQCLLENKNIRGVLIIEGIAPEC